MRIPRRKPDCTYVSDTDNLVELWFDEMVLTTSKDDDIKIMCLSRDGDKLLAFAPAIERNKKTYYQKVELDSKCVIKEWQEYLANKEINNILEE